MSRKQCRLGKSALVLVPLLLAACGGSAQPAQSSPRIPPSPSPDRITASYVTLVHNYWVEYKTAEGNVPRFIKVCWGMVSPGASSDASVVDPAVCQQIAAAIVPPHAKFLSDLSATPAPPSFAADDQAFRKQLPSAIAHINAMIGAARVGDRHAVIDAMTAYVNDMIPIVTNALDDVDPSVVHD